MEMTMANELKETSEKGTCQPNISGKNFITKDWEEAETTAQISHKYFYNQGRVIRLNEVETLRVFFIPENLNLNIEFSGIWF